MTSFSRRAFVKGLAALPLTAALPRIAHANTVWIRYDCACPEGLRMLEIYAQAVRQMEAMGPDNPLSWMWQWYTHFVSGATTKSAELTRIFGEADSPQKALANEVWNTCQSHAGQNSNHFLPWHRAFLYYFERIVRQVTGVPDFALPYWDYTSSDPAKRGVVPPQFRMPDDPVFGSLYRANRTTLANTGQPIHKNQTTDVMDISETMAKTHYSTVDSVMGFCRAVDSGIHGRIHVLVGNSKNMGAVPYAANDPLFWLHHVNIDRMWASWNLAGNTNPTTATWVNNQFTFVDADGTRVRRPLKDFFSDVALGYTYDLYIPTATTMAAKAAFATRPGLRAERVALSRAGAELDARPVRALLEPLAGIRPVSVLGLDDRQPDKRAYLVLKNLHTWKQPEVLYHVYLAPGRGAGLGQARHVGTIHFFDAEFHDHGEHALDMALGDNFYSFDVTDALRAFASDRGRARLGQEALSVLFVPGGRPAPGGKPMVGTIELVRQ
ncbi:tyrosinase family protein [Vulcaniibacterium thermophilum]|uniref:Tyrosinase copper-binding domain-containing protein n=1 Tax=Vulcaniibacterium thermophilum TaxID=1169913 RepID=A0A919DDV5_9GAMM|nr:tyrosinase family protein [Vulcaniibacterium thermophilum]GHE34133.1 hypothetical protein GCM10007167_15300 [Vulcaniibacterium thermophilum]